MAKILKVFTMFIFILGAISCTKGQEAKAEGVIGVTKENTGTVFLDLTPKKFKDGKLFVKIGVNTHSVNNLNEYDLKKITTLEVDGKTYHPTSAPSLGGHHSRGELVFELSAMPKKMTIKIENLNNVALREFKWP